MNLKNKNILIAGISNKKSVAYFIAKSLQEVEANLILTTQHQEQWEFVKKAFPQAEVHLCDVQSLPALPVLPRI